MSKYTQQIESVVALRGTITVAEMSTLLDVSDQTVRRIIKPMVASGQIQKIHGAIKAVENPMTAPFQTRMQHNRAAKAALAVKVADMIEDGQSLAIDTGSTAGFVAQALRIKRNLTIVTNSAYVASTLAMMPGNRVFMAGTQLRDHDGAAFDRAAFETIERMQVDTSILTAAQVHPKRGFLVREQCEADIAKAMSSIAKQSVFAVDHSKFSANPALGMVQISGLTGKLFVACDKGIGIEYANTLSEFESSHPL
ncbi:MAG: DeoR/GlpR transcriptional regulator [Amylibacter sp.]|nr:DeoR/GlpR transcriptional regulator [Amylibacter sp.]